MRIRPRRRALEKILVFTCLLLATGELSGSDAVAAAGSYADVLALLATEDRQACLPELERYETAAVNPERPTASLHKLAAGELGVLRRIARSSGGEALLPVIALHLDSYLYYLERDSRFLLAHSRTLSIEAIDLYLSSAESDEAQALSAWLLTKLAGDVLLTRSRGAAEVLLERALALRKDYARARLGLAAIREKEGRYDEVVSLLMIEPKASDRGEIWLRLAVNLTRTGESNEAAALLERLFRDPEIAPWVRSLAYQEASRQLFDLEQWARARELLEEAVKVLPNDEPLLLQLAYANERLGAPRAAQAAAERFEPRAEVTDDLRPRDRYNRYPRLAAPPEEEQQFDNWIADAHDPLAAALAQLTGRR